MKKIHSLITLLTIITFLSSCLSQKEKAENTKAVISAIKNNNFKFIAQQALPFRGNLISPVLQNLDGSYFLNVNNDTLKCHLPYFGVAQQVPFGSNNSNGIQFETTDFTYEKKINKKGIYEINIVPKKIDNKINNLFLTISENGTASLNVNSYNRDPISFNGIVR